MEYSNFKSGFVNIMGSANEGKSTLLNKEKKKKISIISPKAQTTRKRLLGIYNKSNLQIVFSDTPGILDPYYKLHENMLQYVYQALEDADVILSMVEPNEKEFKNPEIFELLKNASVPIIHLINKADLMSNEQELEEKRNYWKEKLPNAEVHIISALHNVHIDKLLERIIELLPFSPPYFPDDEFTDQTERFIAAEIIREKIFLNYKQEIPYSSEVRIEQFKEKEDIIHIRAIIYVERESQKPIIIGKSGAQIKKMATEARLDMESFFHKKVFLETTVKVLKDWRNNSSLLNKFGYQSF